MEVCGRCTRKKVLPRRATDIGQHSLHIAHGSSLHRLFFTGAVQRTTAPATNRLFRPATKRRKLPQRLYWKTSFTMAPLPESGSQFRIKAYPESMQPDWNEKDADDPIPSDWEKHGRKIEQNIVNMLGKLEESQKSD